MINGIFIYYLFVMSKQNNSVALEIFNKVIQKDNIENHRANDNDDGLQHEVPIDPAYSNQTGCTLKQMVKVLLSNPLAQNQLGLAVEDANPKSLEFYEVLLRNHIFEEIINCLQYSSISDIMTNDISPVYKYDNAWEVVNITLGSVPFWLESMKTSFEINFGSSEPLRKPVESWEDSHNHSVEEYTQFFIRSILRDIGDKADKGNKKKKPEDAIEDGLLRLEDEEIFPEGYLDLLFTLKTPFDMGQVLVLRYMLCTERVILRTSPYIAQLLVSQELITRFTLNNRTLLYEFMSSIWKTLEPVSNFFCVHSEFSKATFMAAIIYSTLTSDPKYKALINDSSEFYSQLPHLYNIFYLLLDLGQTKATRLPTLPQREDIVFKGVDNQVITAKEVKKDIEKCEEYQTVLKDETTLTPFSSADEFPTSKNMKETRDVKISKSSIASSKVTKDTRNNSKPAKSSRSNLNAKAKPTFDIDAIRSLRDRMELTPYSKNYPYNNTAVTTSNSNDPMLAFYILSIQLFENIAENGAIDKLRSLLPEYRTILVVGVLAASRRIVAKGLKESKKGFFGWLTDAEELKALLPHMPPRKFACDILLIYRYVEVQPLEKALADDINELVKYDGRLDFLYLHEFAKALSNVEVDQHTLFCLTLIYRSFEWKKQLRMMDITDYQNSGRLEGAANKLDTDSPKKANEEMLIWIARNDGPHFCVRKEYFEKLDLFTSPRYYKERSSMELEAADGTNKEQQITNAEPVMALGIGTVKIRVHARTAGEVKLRQLVLQDVIYVPVGLKGNVLSLSGPGIYKAYFTDLHTISMTFPNKSKKTKGNSKSRPPHVTALLDSISSHLACILDYGRIKKTPDKSDPAKLVLSYDEMMSIEMHKEKVPPEGTYLGIGDLVPVNAKDL